MGADGDGDEVDYIACRAGEEREGGEGEWEGQELLVQRRWKNGSGTSWPSLRLCSPRPSGTTVKRLCYGSFGMHRRKSRLSGRRPSFGWWDGLRLAGGGPAGVKQAC